MFLGIGCFSQSIRLGMIGSAHLKFGAKYLEEPSPELTKEYGVTITYNSFRQAI